MYIHTYTYDIHIHIYIYIYIERERERDYPRWNQTTPLEGRAFQTYAAIGVLLFFVVAVLVICATL